MDAGDSPASRTGHSDRDERACLDCRPVTIELQLGQRSGRKPTLDRTDCFRCGSRRVGQFVHHSRCAGGVADEQGNWQSSGSSRMALIKVSAPAL